MIDEFIEYGDWEEFDSLVYNFYNCILKKKIGDYEKGDCFSAITFDFEDGVVRLIDEEDNEVEYFINLTFSEINRY